MTKTLESKLNEFFIEHDIENEEVKTALRKVFDTTCETAFLYELMEEAESNDQEYCYDVNFTALLDSYVYIFLGKNAVNHIEQIFGYYGTDIFYISDDFQGLVVSSL
ncbi:hypothetical protein [Enterococcus phage vB_EfaS_Ef7.1]|nr:hypothetical protein [Enterococcus phage vB_EfaS_Ef7.1]